MQQVLRERTSVAAGIAAAAAWLVLQFSGVSWSEIASSVIAAGAALVAAAMCLRARRAMTGERRLGWTFVGIGCASWGIGNACWPIYQLTLGSVPLPSMVDLGCLGMIPCLMAGAFFLIGRRRGALRIVFDGLLISGSLLMVSWSTVFGEALRADIHGLGRLIVLAYPIGDVAVATMMPMLLIHNQGERRSTALVGLGMLGLCVADSGYAYLINLGLGDFGFFAYTGWVGCFVLVGMGARAASGHRRPAARELSPRLLALPYIPLALALGTAATVYFTTGVVDPLTVVLGLGLVVLVLSRQVVALRDNVRLSTQLEKTVAELRDSQGRLQHMAFFDQLTGLANRAEFYRSAEALFKPGPSAELPVAVLFIDLDHFKPVNDRLGHAAGDELLALVAERLRASVRETDVVARLGGDEFAVLLGDVPSDQVIQNIADRLLSELARPFAVAGEQVGIGASIGMVIEEDRKASVDHLLARADSAMYEAKSRGRSRLVAA